MNAIQSRQTITGFYADVRRRDRRDRAIWLCVFALGMAIFCSTLPGCSMLPRGFSGAFEPTGQTFELSAADIESAKDRSCWPSWITGDDAADLAAAHTALKAAGAPVVQRRTEVTKFAVTLRKSVSVPPDFDTRSEGDQARLLAHEYVHVCQRKRMGDADFEAAVALSAGRWRLETAAYAMTAHARTVQGQTATQIVDWADAKVGKFRDDYALHDIDPTQYEEHTRAIWLESSKDARKTSP